jgi:matrixin
MDRGSGIRLAAAACVLASLCGCRQQAGAALGPSSTPRVVRLLAGDDGRPVGGASVRIGSRTARSDGDGQVLIEPADGDAFEVEANGFLHRQTSVGRSERFVLWPTGPQYPEDYVRALLYVDAGRSGPQPPAVRDQPLRRVMATSVSVVPSDELRRDPLAWQAHQRAAAMVTEITGAAVRFEVDPRPAADVTFRTSVDPSAGTVGALTYRTLKAEAIVGGRVTFSDLRYARDVRFVAHELGHALGLQHSPDPADMMHFVCGAGCAESFSERERLTVRLLLLRRPGNSYPDRDPGLAAASFAGEGDLIVN